MAKSCDYNTKAKVPKQRNWGNKTTSKGQITGGGICAKVTKAKREIASGPFGIGGIL